MQDHVLHGVELLILAGHFWYRAQSYDTLGLKCLTWFTLHFRSFVVLSQQPQVKELVDNNIFRFETEVEH